MIHRLPDDVIDRIAAGEVVERPASVVKELVENALDAGAGRITIHLEAGGRRLIRVADDGGGMTADDLTRAFVRHATSKLTRVEDLFHVASLGFRGEALASIGAVSRARISTRAGIEAEGRMVDNEGGCLGEVRPVGCPPGTIVEVRDLFYNVAPRLKFLKTEATELSHCVDWVTRFTLANREVGFTLIHNNRNVFKVEPAASFRQRIAHFFGEETEAALLPVNREVQGITVGGFLGRPELGRKDMKRSFLFLNGRNVRDKTVHAALKRAFSEVLPGKFNPAYFLDLVMPPEEVDVNVHPTKIEVRFLDGSNVFSAVYRVVTEALAEVESLTGISSSGVEKPGGGSTDTGTRPSGGGELWDRRFNDPRGKVYPERGETFHKDDPSFERRFEREEGMGVEGGWGSIAESQGNAPMDHEASTVGASRLGAYNPVMPDFEPDTYPGSPSNSAHEGHSAQAGDRYPDRAGVAPVRRILQVHRTYAVYETPEGFAIVDQHALHERILYERLRRQYEAGGIHLQLLLVPLKVPLDAIQATRTDELCARLEEVGIRAKPSGERALVIEALPALVRRAEPMKLIREIIERITEEGDPRNDSDEVAYRALLQRMACRTAVKAGDGLDEQELMHLLNEADHAEWSGRCPHGRPTRVLFSLAEIEELFKRRGF